MEVIGILWVLALNYLFLFSYWCLKPKRKKDYSLQILQWDQSRQIRMSLFHWHANKLNNKDFIKEDSKNEGIYLSEQQKAISLCYTCQLPGFVKTHKTLFSYVYFLFVWDPEHWFGRLAEENTRVTNSFDNWHNSETSLSDFLETLVRTFSTLLQKVVDYPVI